MEAFVITNSNLEYLQSYNQDDEVPVARFTEDLNQALQFETMDGAMQVARMLVKGGTLKIYQVVCAQ